MVAHLGKEQGYRSNGAIIGGAVGGLVAINLIIFSVFWIVKKKIRSMFVSYTPVAIAV